MCSFPDSFKKWVGTGEVPPAAAFPYTLPLHHLAFAASHAACPPCPAIAATVMSTQLEELGLACLRLGNEMQLVATCENPGFHGAHGVRRQP